jgi:hypothetical protein
MAVGEPARIVDRVHEAADLIDRLDALAARAERTERRAADLAEVEDMLATGYSGALSGEARMMRLEQKLDELLATAMEDRARELRLIVREHRALERSVAQLRMVLARLQAQFVVLGSTAPR